MRAQSSCLQVHQLTEDPPTGGLWRSKRKHISPFSKHITTVERLAISIISQPDLKTFHVGELCLCVWGIVVRGGACYAVLSQQLNPSNFTKNKHSSVAGGKLRGAETSGKITSSVALSLVWWCLLITQSRHFPRNQKSNSGGSAPEAYQEICRQTFRC